MPNSQIRIKVLICNPCTLLRDGIKALFRNEGPIEIVGEAATGQEAIAQVDRLKPDVVLLDVDFPDMSGVTTMHGILAINPSATVLILTLSRNHRTQIARCLELGAAGRIGSRDLPSQLEAVIPAAASRRKIAMTNRRHFTVGRKIA